MDNIIDNQTGEVLPAVSAVVQPSALQALEAASIDVAIATAHKFPRSVARFARTARELACINETVAAECFYHLPRGKGIEGPSIRLAEIVAYAWGNLRVGARIIEETDKFVTAQGICHDLERNVSASTEVRRRITDKAGRRYNDDMVIMTMNAACAVARRNAIFQVIPGAMVQEIEEAAKRVAVGSASTLVKKREKVVTLFTKMGVDQARLEAFLGHEIEEIGLEDLQTLQGMFTALKDGTSTVDELFPEPVTEPPVGRTKRQAAPRQPDPDPAEPPIVEDAEGGAQ